tara:strand:- start:367 stop:486 length:120 start_codon:yes stop_codon:yes gene_type:complete
MSDTVLVLLFLLFLLLLLVLDGGSTIDGKLLLVEGEEAM